MNRMGIVGIGLIAASLVMAWFTLYLSPGYYNRRRETVCYLLGAACGVGVALTVGSCLQKRDAT